MTVTLELKVHYLEMIQDIIRRMQHNSFILKGWSVTLMSGGFALLSKDPERPYFIIPYIPLVLFWILDSYYLQVERKYRILYNAAIKKELSEIDFSLETPKSCRIDKTCFYQSLLSKTEIIFYLISSIPGAVFILSLVNYV